MTAKPLFACLGLVLLTACGAGGDGLRNLDSELTGPDEFSVLPAQPLVVPDQLSLPPPTPGAANRADVNPVGDAIAVLGGNQAALSAGGIPTTDAALVTYASRNGVEPDIRSTLAQADADYRSRAGLGSTFNILGNDQYYPAYANQALDAYDELDRLRAQGTPVPTAPPLQ